MLVLITSNAVPCCKKSIDNVYTQTVDLNTIILYTFIYFQLTKGFRVMAQYCNNPVTISGRPELIVSRANISPSSSGLVDKPTNILSTIFIVSTFPVDATALAHRLMKSQLPQANDDVFAGSS